MYVNTNGVIVQNNEQYIAIDGTGYPTNYPKSEIAELHLVTEVAKPTDPTVNITGYTVNGSYLQVWTTVAKDQTELNNDLANAKYVKIVDLYGLYISNREADVSFTAADASTKDYQAGAVSVEALSYMLQTYPVTTPVGFYWVPTDNSHVAFTRADLVGLAFAIGDRANTYFQNLQTKKNAVLAATTLSEVDAITW